jgi:hypothetical protein
MAIRRDHVARQMFHPKHIKDSQSLKNVAEYVLKCAVKVKVEGYPDWYLDTLPTIGQ